MLINRQQPMRPAEVALIDAVDALQSNVTELGGKLPVNTLDIADGAVTSAKLEATLQTAISFLATVPDIEFGTSNSITVPANSQTSVDVTFAAKSEIPLVFVGIQFGAASGNLYAYVSSVTNTQASIVVVNASSTDADSVTVDYLTISGR